ncbi:MAG: hypothetical protein K2K85_05635 [Clostridia bacterium]|nr:hypothetical protein [Clostridia bacterium]
MQSQILTIFYEIEENQIDVDKKIYEMQLDKVISIQEKLQKIIEGNDELKKIFDELDNAVGDYHSAMLAAYYVAGFKCGARISLEVFGEDR